MASEMESRDALEEAVPPTPAMNVPEAPDPLETGTGRPLAGLARRVANVESQFEATGFALVLVELAEASASAAAVTMTARSRREAVPEPMAAQAGLTDMEKYFVVPPEAQDAALARQHVDTIAHRGVPRGGDGQNVGAAATTRAARRRHESVDTTIPKVRVFPNLGLMLGTVTRQGLKDVLADPRVSEVQGAPSISLIRPMRRSATSRQKGVTWGIARLGVPQLWEAGFTGQGVLVGHLDTGVDGSHPALHGAIKSFAEFDMVGMPIAGARPRDFGEHGTHTAGTIAGRAVGTTQFGVAPEAQLASALVIEGGNVVARILAGLDWMVGQRVQIVSASLGLRGFTPAFLMVSRLLRARGILPVFAVGNEGPGTSRSPGNYAEVLSVGACDDQDLVADFSGSQRFARAEDPVAPDIVAPGVAVLSCIPGGQYAEMDGSSMATPHIAGLAALLWQATNATANEIEKAIFDSCQLALGLLPDRAGRGLPNGPRAYELLMGTPLVARTPRPTKPVAKKPVRGKPVAKKPVVKMSVRKKPVTKKPVTKKPVTKKPVTKKSAAKKPVAGKAAAKRASAKTGSTRKRATRKHSTRKPEGTRGAVKKAPTRRAQRQASATKR